MRMSWSSRWTTKRPFSCNRDTVSLTRVSCLVFAYTTPMTEMMSRLMAIQTRSSTRPMPFCGRELMA